MKKDKQDVVIGIVVPDSMKDLVIDLAERAERSIAAQLRVILNEGLKSIVKSETDAALKARIQAAIK